MFADRKQSVSKFLEETGGAKSFQPSMIGRLLATLRAIGADPDLADNLTTECRYRSTEEEPFYERVETVNTEARYLAARCAALAG